MNQTFRFRVEPSICDPEGLIGQTTIVVTNYATPETTVMELPLLPKELLSLVYGTGQ